MKTDEQIAKDSAEEILNLLVPDWDSSDFNPLFAIILTAIQSARGADGRDAARWRKFKLMPKQWAYDAIEATSLRYGNSLEEAIDAAMTKEASQ
jgi:hypothetical protein